MNFNSDIHFINYSSSIFNFFCEILSWIWNAIHQNLDWLTVFKIINSLFFETHPNWSWSEWMNHILDSLDCILILFSYYFRYEKYWLPLLASISRFTHLMSSNILLGCHNSITFHVSLYWDTLWETTVCPDVMLVIPTIKSPILVHPVGNKEGISHLITPWHLMTWVMCSVHLTLTRTTVHLWTSTGCGTLTCWHLSPTRLTQWQSLADWWDIVSHQLKSDKPTGEQLKYKYATWQWYQW